MNSQDKVIALVNLANIQVSLQNHGLIVDSKVITRINEESLKILEDL